MLKVLKLIVGQMQTNCYLVYDEKTKETVIIDPGDAADYIERVISDKDLNPKMILASHGHYDHILAAQELVLAYKIPFLINIDDSFLVERMAKSARHFGYKGPLVTPRISGYLKNGQQISLKSFNLSVLVTPGHTPGSSTFYIKKENMAFVGDLFFADGTVGRTDFSYANAVKLKESIAKLKKLPKKTIFYSGH